MIELEGVPELIDPVMVAAFEGWNDAGDAASTAVAHLDREWKGEVFAALDAEDYYDFQVNRPTVFMEAGVRKITWPTTRLSVVRVGGDKPRDLVLVRGIEPSMRWRSFCNEILGFAHELGVEMVVILGALLGSSALLILLLAAVAGLSEVMPAWAASLIVGGAVAVVAVILLLAGRSRLKAKTLVPDRTLASVSDDVRMAREHLK